MTTPTTELQLWKLNDHYFEGAKTYTLAIGGSRVSFRADDKALFSVSPPEAANVPLYAVAKRVK